LVTAHPVNHRTFSAGAILELSDPDGVDDHKVVPFIKSIYQENNPTGC